MAERNGLEVRRRGWRDVPKKFRHPISPMYAVYFEHSQIRERADEIEEVRTAPKLTDWTNLKHEKGERKSSSLVPFRDEQKRVDAAQFVQVH